MRGGWLAGGLALLIGCAGAGASDADESAQAVEELDERLALILADAETGGRVARVGRTEYAIVGAPVASLEVGREYALDVKTTTAAADHGRTTLLVVAARKVLGLVGTLSDDPADPSVMRIKTATRDLRLFGATVTSYRRVSAALPGHDYSATPFRVRALPDRADGARLTWLAYAPIAKFACADKAEPDVHLDLVSVRPDEAILDGFVETRGAGEALYGPRATCKREADLYDCALDEFGSVWGRGRFSAGAAFELPVERDGAAPVVFACTTVDLAAALAGSD